MVDTKHIVFIEAENFDDLGGWVIDQQFMDIMGSPFVLAHGLGEPVADAVQRDPQGAPTRPGISAGQKRLRSGRKRCRARKAGGKGIERSGDKPGVGGPERRIFPPPYTQAGG